MKNENRICTKEFSEREIEVINSANSLKCRVVVNSTDTFKDVVLSCRAKIGFAFKGDRFGFSYCGINFTDSKITFGDIMCSGNIITVFPLTA